MTRGYDSPVEVLSAPVVTGGYGVQGRDWDHATATAYLAWVGSAKTSEESQSATSVETGLTVHLPGAAVVSSVDRVRFRGEVYDIQGDPQVFFRRGVLDHYEVALQRVEYTP